MNKQVARGPAGLPMPLNGPLAGAPRLDPRVQQLLGNLQLKSQADAIQIATLQQQLKHFVGILILMLQDNEKYPEQKARVKLADFENIPGDAALDSDEVVGEYLTVKLSNQREYELKIKGFQEATQLCRIPKRSPFAVNVAIPPGGEFEGCVSVHFKGGKSDGKELTRAQRPDGSWATKPKKVREYVFDKNGTFIFTTDSSGLEVEIVYIVKKPGVEPEAEPDTSPLECKDGWHRDLDAAGMRCSECGDTRKIEGLVAKDKENRV